MQILLKCEYWSITESCFPKNVPQKYYKNSYDEKTEEGNKQVGGKLVNRVIAEHSLI